MTKSINDKQVQNRSICGRKALNGTDNFIIGYFVKGVLLLLWNINDGRLQPGVKIMFVVFPVMINGCMDQNLSDPSLE